MKVDKSFVLRQLLTFKHHGLAIEPYPFDWYTMHIQTRLSSLNIFVKFSGEMPCTPVLSMTPNKQPSSRPSDSSYFTSSPVYGWVATTLYNIVNRINMLWKVVKVKATNKSCWNCHESGQIFCFTSVIKIFKHHGLAIEPYPFDWYTMHIQARLSSLNIFVKFSGEMPCTPVLSMTPNKQPSSRPSDSSYFTSSYVYGWVATTLYSIVNRINMVWKVGKVKATNKSCWNCHESGQIFCFTSVINFYTSWFSDWTISLWLIYHAYTSSVYHHLTFLWNFQERCLAPQYFPWLLTSSHRPDRLIHHTSSPVYGWVATTLYSIVNRINMLWKVGNHVEIAMKVDKSFVLRQLLIFKHHGLAIEPYPFDWYTMHIQARFIIT